MAITITYELDLETFEAWSGAQDTLNRVINEGRVRDLESILEDLYPDGMDETQLNDILRFEEDLVYEMCGIRSESAIREELEEAQEELEELMENFLEECENMTDFNNESREEECLELMDEEEIESMKNEIWEIDYKADAEELEDRIKELEEELENI